MNIIWRFAKRKGTASAAFLGLGLAAIGVFYDVHTLTLFGALSSAIAGLIAAIQQNEFHEMIEAQNRQLAEQSQRIASMVTGGLSFCHGYPFRENGISNLFEWTFIHAGRDPIFDVSVRIVHVDRIKNDETGRELIGRSFKLGTLFPGKAHDFGITSSNPEFVACNLFFSARNGDWTQEIRRVRVPDGYTCVNRVQRWTDVFGERLALYEVSENFPRSQDGELEWGALPPIR